MVAYLLLKWLRLVLVLLTYFIIFGLLRVHIDFQHNIWGYFPEKFTIS